MKAGDLVAGRFRLERLAGAGGMGVVFEATDLTTSERVALKVLSSDRDADLSRFEAEAHVLADLSHPGIVRYVAHGLATDTPAPAPSPAPSRAPRGVPYLAMEWLAGESLEDRLARTGLTMAETAALAVRVADTLAWAHEHGVIHRDIKPSNLFLCDAEGPPGARVLDFGIARRRYGDRALTRTGVVMGTPGYMAPEQARGERDVDARADLFSLGCVLFECLAGQPAFSGAHVMAVLAKVLLDEPPPLRELAPAVPPDLADLVAALLQKDPAARPASASLVAASLRALGPLDDGPFSRVRQPPPPSLTTGEQRLVSVLLIAPAPDAAAPAPPEDDLTGTTAPMAASQRSPESEAHLRALAASFGGALDRLADGTRLMTVAGARAATDQAAAAARAALALRAALPDRAMVLATGRARVDGRSPIGEVLDRAARLLRDQQRRARPAPPAPAQAPLAPPPAPLAPVTLDDLTAGLLDARFDVRRAPAPGLWGELARDRPDAERTVLGKPTPLVGRERELRLLEDLLAESVAESEARAAVVTADAGIGKSRLRHELVRRARASHPDAAIWIARADPVAAPRFGMLAQIVRQAARVQDGEPLDDRRAKLAARVADSVPPPDRERVTWFLAEMIGAPFPASSGVQLEAARADARLMGDQIRRAFTDFLDAECARRPALLVLEDLQWADLPTVELVDATLRLASHRPLLVLALARPEAAAQSPELWASRGAVHVRLRELSRKACDRIVRDVLGDRATPSTLDRIADRSGGNPFLLEELLRAAADGLHDDDVPGTVLAMVQSRLERLEPSARRVLRAASVLGQTFWRGAVSALLGDTGPAALDDVLHTLERDEWIAARPASRFRAETELTFRHALVRDAAYQMLTDDDRALGHRIAAAWLEDAGETSALVIAEHLARGQRPAAAVDWFRRAAEQAQVGNDWSAVIACVHRAVDCGASGETLGHLLVIEADASRWRGDHASTERAGAAALELLPRASEAWFAAAGALAGGAGKLGHIDRVVALLPTFTAAWADVATPTVTHVLAAMMFAPPLFSVGKHAEAHAVCALAEAGGARIPPSTTLDANLHVVRSWKGLFDADPAANRHHALLAAEAFERAGDLRNAAGPRTNAACASALLGAYDDAIVILRRALADSERLGLRYVAASALTNLCLSLARSGHLDEAIAAGRAAIADLDAQGGRRMGGAARLYLAMAQLAAADLPAADATIREAIAAFEITPPFRAYALAVQSRIARARGDLPAARAHASEAFALLTQLGSLEEGEATVLLAQAESLLEAGELPAARSLLLHARAHVEHAASRIADPAWRASFLEAVPENARLLQLARDYPSPD